MNKLKTIILNFFRHSLWLINTDKNQSPARYYVMKSLRIFLSSIFKFHKQEGFIRAASLTYFSINAMVPFLALAIWITARFAFTSRFKQTLINLQPKQADIINTVFEFAQNMLSNIPGGMFFFVGTGLLLWSVFSIMNSIEYSLNYVWSVRYKRGLKKKIFINFATALLFPFFIFISVSITAVMKQSVIDLLNEFEILNTFHLGAMLPVLFFLLNYILLAGLFSLVYFIFPNQKMKYYSAFLGGLVAAILFILAERLYIYSQASIHRASAIFGVFAALPMFLIWLYTSWIVILFGAYISFHFETYPSFSPPHEEKISIVYIKKLSLAIFRVVEREGDKRTLRALHINELSRHFVSSHQQISTALQYLLDAKLLGLYERIPYTYCLVNLDKKYTDKQILEIIEHLYSDASFLQLIKKNTAKTAPTKNTHTKTTKTKRRK